MTTVQQTVHVVVHPAEEGGYWAEVLELPGCMSQGETQGEALANVRGALRDVIQSYLADGEPLPFATETTVETLQIEVPA